MLWVAIFDNLFSNLDISSYLITPILFPIFDNVKKGAQQSISTEKWHKLASMEFYDFSIKLMRKDRNFMVLGWKIFDFGCNSVQEQN